MLRLLQIALLLSFSFSAAAIAGPVTGQSAVTAYDQATAPTESQAVTDERTAPASVSDGVSIFDSLGMPLLRLSAPLYLQLGPHGKLRSLGGDAGDGGGGGGGDSGSGGSGDIGNVSVQPPGTGDPGTGGGGVPSVQIPEPATLGLLAPALFLALRRRIREKRVRP
jgi:hypothetical protein